MQISIQPLTQTNLIAADAVLQAAYQSASQQERLTRYLQLQPDGWIVAYLEERLVGLVGAILYDNFAYLGSMGVHPDAQRRGVGGALMHHILAWLDQQHCPTILLDATTDGAALYTHFGFVTDDQTNHWQRSTTTIQTIPQPPQLTHTTPSYLHRAPLHPQDLPAIAQFDAAYFGADRTAILNASIAENPGRAFLTRGSRDELTGYLIAQQKNLGPWVANNQQAAEALLRQALALPFQQPVTVLTSTTNQAASSLLKHYDFTCIRTLQHMRRGQPATLRRRDAIYGQVSFALG
jgi:GNAT superfamily N-acetyltransferase